MLLPRRRTKPHLNYCPPAAVIRKVRLCSYREAEQKRTSPIVRRLRLSANHLMR